MKPTHLLHSTITVSGTGTGTNAEVSYSGSVCGYDVNADLHVGAGV